MAYAETTTVPVEKTRGEIERMLIDRKCDQFMVFNDRENKRANSTFTTEGEAFLNVRERIEKGIADARQKIAKLSEIGNAADERLYLLGLKAKS